MARCAVGKKRNIYLVSKAVKDVLTQNEDRIKVINTGIKVFCRSDNRDTTCAFRLTHEGITTMLPFLRHRVVSITRGDVVNLLTNEIPVNNKMSMDTRGQLCDLVGGSIALVYREEKESSPLQVSLVGWKGKTSVRAYIPKNEKVHFLRLVGVDTTMFEHNKFNYKAGGSRSKETGEKMNLESEENNAKKTKLGVMEESKKDNVRDDESCKMEVTEREENEDSKNTDSVNGRNQTEEATSKGEENEDSKLTDCVNAIEN
jgi:tRNA (cytosine34-C5)-methyltransferase